MKLLRLRYILQVGLNILDTAPEPGWVVPYLLQEEENPEQLQELMVGEHGPPLPCSCTFHPNLKIYIYFVNLVNKTWINMII